MSPPRDDDAGGTPARARPGPPISPVLLARARQARQLRATMSGFLPADLLVDPAWDMVIDLFIAAATGEPLFVKDLILMSGESPASALRRIDRLQTASLLTRLVDPRDHRRVQVRLTNKGVAAMSAMLDHLFDANTGPATQPPPVSFSPSSLTRS